MARAWLERRDDDAERLQAEVVEAERQLAARPPLVALKAGVAEAMAARGGRYLSALRSPLGT